MNYPCLYQGIAKSLLIKMMISALSVKVEGILCAVMDVQGLFMNVGFTFLSVGVVLHFLLSLFLHKSRCPNSWIFLVLGFLVGPLIWKIMKIVKER